MDTMKKKLIGIGAAMLIVGAALGFGIARTSETAHPTKSSSPATAKIEKDKEVDNDSSAVSRTDAWDPFREMERMHEEIDRAIRRATEQFRLGSGAALVRPDLGYSSSLDVRDRNDHFEVRAYLPDAESSDVKVTTEGDKTLKVNVSHRAEDKKKEGGGEVMFSELGQYEQLVTLPEAVVAKDMKMERKDHEVVITIPKAKKS